MVVPRPIVDSISSVPPRSASRSRIPAMPRPPSLVPVRCAKGSKPGPSSSIVSRNVSSERSIMILSDEACGACLTIFVKHAPQASSVSIIIDRSDDTLRLTIEDDGPGFDPLAQRTGTRDGGLGIAGMRERLALLGGTLEIESTIGRGTTIYARIPAEAERLIA